MVLTGDQRRGRLSVEQAAPRLGATRRAYRALEAGERSPDWEMFDRICRTFGGPQTFATPYDHVWQVRGRGSGRLRPLQVRELSIYG
jgi:DNA-binding XRE family transcriptional regulator